MTETIEGFLKRLETRNPGELEFVQAVREIVESVWHVIERTPRYRSQKILDRLTEPERAIVFRVPWVTERGELQVNRGFRVEFSSVLGPYRGGLRFHPSANLSQVKFLGFEQVFKNALPGLPMGGAKGGSDFDPKGKDNVEVMNFCQAFMNELYRHVGPSIDVLGGGLGVGGREIGFLTGMYKKLSNQHQGPFTGKGLNFGGSLIRPEATGYGVVYFALEMLATRGQTLAGKRVLISGSGNVAQFATEKALEHGAHVLTLSDSSGTIYDPEGLNREKLDFVMRLKNERRGRIREYAERFPSAEYLDGERPWSVPCDVALPCASQNEISGEEAAMLLGQGCTCVAEGANWPSTPTAVERFLDARILYGPGKAANAGGVAVSHLEMVQNAIRLPWSREEVDRELRKVMNKIHATCVRHGRSEDSDVVNYVDGANVGAFVRVADAMIEQGVV